MKSSSLSRDLLSFNNEDQINDDSAAFLSDAESFQVWSACCNFIREKLLDKKGVCIPNLSIFSFNEIKLDVGRNKFVHIYRPVFQLTEKICSRLDLKQNATKISNSIPISTINYSVISLNLMMSRDQIELCVRKVITTIQRAIASNNKTELTFPNIGELNIFNQKIKFKFFKSFVKLLNDADHLISCMRDRPGTCDSIITEKSIKVRGGPKVPKIMLNFETSSNKEKPSMKSIGSVELETISEEGKDQIYEEAETFIKSPSRSDQDINNVLDDFSMHQNNQKQSSTNFLRELQVAHDEVIPDSNTSQAHSIKLFNNRQEFNFKSKDDTPDPLTRMTSNCRRSRSFSIDSRPISKQALDKITLKVQKEEAAPKIENIVCHACHDREIRNDYNATILKDKMLAKKQETENRETEMLNQYQELRNAHARLKEQEAQMEKNMELKKIYGFNAGLAENERFKRSQKDTASYESFLLKHRPITPPKSIKQIELSQWLNEQICLRREREQARKAAEAQRDCNEQVALAADLARQREQFWREKAETKEKYKRALSAQIRSKNDIKIPSETSSNGSEVNNSILLGGNEPNLDLILKKRKLAQDVQKEQQQLVEIKYHDKQKQKEREKAFEIDVINKAREGMIENRAEKFLEMFKQRKNLEAAWLKAKQDKLERELSQRLADKKPPPEQLIPLHEQCTVERCDQCQRRLENVGSSSLLRDTFFSSGARYIC